jgi:hypothetical protein
MLETLLAVYRLRGEVGEGSFLVAETIKNVGCCLLLGAGCLSLEGTTCACQAPICQDGSATTRVGIRDLKLSPLAFIALDSVGGSLNGLALTIVDERVASQE